METDQLKVAATKLMLTSRGYEKEHPFLSEIIFRQRKSLKMGRKKENNLLHYQAD